MLDYLCIHGRDDDDDGDDADDDDDEEEELIKPMPSIGPYPPEEGTVDFSTSGEWTADDLSSLMEALDAIYVTTLLSRFLAISFYDRANEWVGEMLKAGPAFGHLWFDIVGAWGNARSDMPLPALAAQLGLLPGLGPDGRSVEREIDFYLAHPGDFMQPSQQLGVNRVQMASPGMISLKGLGEPLRQIRELIKDLWYRNRQERALGELEVTRRWLELATHHGLAPQQNQALAIEIITGGNDIGRLIREGKLTLPDEKLLPPGDTAPAKMRTRRRTSDGGDPG